MHVGGYGARDGAIGGPVAWQLVTELGAVIGARARLAAWLSRRAVAGAPPVRAHRRARDRWVAWVA